MADSVLRTKTKEFAKDIVFLCRMLKQNSVESPLINQLLRCGTSVGANVHEAQYAQGTKDFISKFEIALKECNESEYWLELLYETNSISEVEFKNLQKECIELRRMLVSSVTTLKNK
ncbi:MAG: four helix bundle protein [Ruminococcaceae bacterium]|nr:four helix bundle protein [Oscillospiraceae bacterium]